jgi:hypothetical protein
MGRPTINNTSDRLSWAPGVRSRDSLVPPEEPNRARARGLAGVFFLDRSDLPEGIPPIPIWCASSAGSIGCTWRSAGAETQKEDPVGANATRSRRLARDTGRPRLMSSTGARDQPGAAGQGRQSADALRASARAARRFFFLCAVFFRSDLRFRITKNSTAP